VEPVSVDLKEKMAEVAVVVEDGPRTMEVFGGVVSPDAPRAFVPSETSSSIAAPPMKSMVRKRVAW
jgi:hypothetical protein